MIEHYSFGRMVVDGRAFSSDLIIFPDGTVLDSWWRDSGHSLSAKDIGPLVESKPEIIVAGTGASGLMHPEHGLERFLASRDIAFQWAPSREAVAVFNKLSGERRVGACFHLTC
jgi:hypothetical protein